MTDLQAAAERLRRLKRHGGSDSVFVTHGNGDAVSLNDVKRDYESVVDAYIAEHLPDDDVAIDADWWQQLTKDQNCGFLWIDVETWLFRDAEGNLWIEDPLTAVPMRNITTRGQLRLLARALGVELGEGR